MTMLHLKGDGAERGFRAGEVLYFTFGAYSDFIVSRHVVVVRDVPPSEILDVATVMPTQHVDSLRRVHTYRSHDDFIRLMVERGAFRVVPVSQVDLDCDEPGHRSALCMEITTRDD